MSLPYLQWCHKEANRASHARLSANEAESLKGPDHIMDSGRRGADEELQIAFCRRLSMDGERPGILSIRDAQALTDPYRPKQIFLAEETMMLQARRASLPSFLQDTLLMIDWSNCRGRGLAIESFCAWGVAF